MVGEEIFSETQGPENLENRSQPGQRPSSRIGRVTRHQPVSNAGERLAEKGKSRLGAVQAAGPAAKRGGIGHAIGIFERGQSPLPRNNAPQSAAAMPDSAPASCNACKGEKAAEGR